jgi:hypothetical protein
MKETIGREEKLYRKVIRNPDFLKTEQGRPTSELFKDSKGVSVDRDDKTITQSYMNRFGSEDIKALIYVEASFCSSLSPCHTFSPLILAIAITAR